MNMKVNNIVVFLLLAILIGAVWFYQGQNLWWQKTNTSTVGSREGNSTWSELLATWSWSEKAPKVDIEKVVASLESEQKAFALFWDNSKEELENINSYYSNKASTDFFIYSALRDKNIAECDKISKSSEKDSCKLIYEHSNDNKYLQDLFVKLWDSQESSKMYVATISSIVSSDCSKATEFLQYLSCKKILNKEFDANNYAKKMAVLSISNADLVKKYYKDIVVSWGLDVDLLPVIEATLIKK